MLKLPKFKWDHSPDGQKYSTKESQAQYVSEIKDAVKKTVVQGENLGVLEFLRKEVDELTHVGIEMAKYLNKHGALEDFSKEAMDVLEKFRHAGRALSEKFYAGNDEWDPRHAFKDVPNKDEALSATFVALESEATKKGVELYKEGPKAVAAFRASLSESQNIGEKPATFAQRELGKLEGTRGSAQSR